MMFLFHINLALTYLSLLAATALVVWSMQNRKNGHVLGKVVGTIIFLLSLLSILCITYHSFKHWIAGNAPWGMPMDTQIIEHMKSDQSTAQ